MTVYKVANTNQSYLYFHLFCHFSSQDGYTPLMLATMYGHIEVIIIILKQGVAPGVKSTTVYLCTINPGSSGKEGGGGGGGGSDNYVHK